MSKISSYLKEAKDYDAKALFKLVFWTLKNHLFGIKFPMAISIDVTNKCNLRCKHCYFFKQNHQRELSEAELIEKIKRIKKENPGIIHASWVGGEPLLRKKVVEEGAKLFPLNMIVTNGTLELPKLKNCNFYVSVDGTKKYYEQIRGGNYDKVKENIERAEVPVAIKCVLNKQNCGCVEEMLKEWKETRARGIVFDFYTPVSGIKEDLWLNFKERDKVLDNLLELKKVYGDFISNSETSLRLMKSENCNKITENCILKKAVLCLDPLGGRKFPCVIGEKANCSKCGCIVPFYMEQFRKFEK
jgi:MoaA/NifB/PqqE/SkfB family radical SAM enzyme